METQIVDTGQYITLVAITAWYARSTFRMLEEMRNQARLLALSVAASVEAGIIQGPAPGEFSDSQHIAWSNLVQLQKPIAELLGTLYPQIKLKPHR